MDVFGIDTEILGNFLSDAARSSLGEKLIVVTLVWFAISSKVKKHFEKIEQSVSAIPTIAKSVNDLKDAIVDLEVKQTERINQISQRVTKLEEKQ